MKHDTTDTTPGNANGLLFVLRGWSRGCATLARREFARSLGRKRFTPADREAFAKACVAARTGASAVTAVAALVLAARPSSASGDILRGNNYASPGAGSTQQQAAVAAAQQRQAAQVQRARDSLARTTQALQAMRLAQDAARSAASMNAGNIYNGLGANGLRVAAGATPGTSLWQNAEAPKESVSGGRTQVEIVQTDKKAVLTWDEFNIGLNTDLYFNQKAGGADAAQWIALNRVTDVTTNPSQILGSMKAEGQVYVINPNGVVFHGSSQVNVHTLVASGLDFKGDTVAARDAAFQQGLASDDNRDNYTLGVDDGSGRKVGDVTVNQGARLVSDGSGAIYLFGKNVSNAGTILAPDGQALMAAGDRVWVTKNSLGTTHDTPNPDLRGVRATVQNDALEADGVTSRTAGKVVNSGLMEAERGNVTLSAKDVENSGALHTSTTTKANGSVTLLAGDAASSHDQYWMWPTEFGRVVLSPGSLIAITPDDDAGTAFARQYRPGVIEVHGHTVLMDEGARIHAPSANLTMVAKTHTADATAENDSSRIYLASGSQIDLAGLAGVEVAMERNTVTGNLRLDELKDSPLLRESPLRGAKVSVDIRRDTTLADMSGYYGLIEYGVEELMTTGGTLKLDSGSIVTRAGSGIDLSGGFVQYRDGYVETTRLKGADGRIYDITNARNDIAYTGVYDVSRRFESGYTEGRNAGSLILGSQTPVQSGFPETLNPSGEGARPYFLALDGDLLASTTIGKYQRNEYKSDSIPREAWTRLARAATLSIGYEREGVSYGPNVRVADTAALPADFGFETPFDVTQARNLTISSRFFDGKTFGEVRVISGIGGGVFTVDSGVSMNLGAFGLLDFHGAQAFVHGAILAPGGSVSLVADIAKGWKLNDVDTPLWETMAESDRPVIAMGTSGRIDVAGEWVNELKAGSAYGTLAIHGGAVELRSAHNLTLAAGSVIDVGGGGRLTSANRIINGDAGAITLQNDLLPRAVNGFGGNNIPTAPSGSFDILSADLRGFALGKGGSLSIGASRPVTVTSAPETPAGVGASDTLFLSPEFFRQGGFADFMVAGSREVRVTSGTTIEPLALSLIADGALWNLSSGGRPGSVLSTGYKPVELREPGSLTLAVALRDSTGGVVATASDPGLLPGLLGTLVMETGSRIAMDPGSSVSLLSLGDLSVDGEIFTPGGEILLGVTDATAASLRLGRNARLLAPGHLRTDIVDGLPVRSVHAAGSVSLKLVNPQGLENHLYVDRESLIDVSGISGYADLLNTESGLMGGPVVRNPVAVGGAAGSVAFMGFEDGFVAGRILAAPGAESAAGGSITIQAGVLHATSNRTGLVLTERLTDRVTDAPLFPSVEIGSASPSVRGETLSIYTPSLRASGADDLAFLSSSGVAFDGGLTLETRRSLSFGTPALGFTTGAPVGETVALKGAYVRFHGFPNAGDSLFPIPDAPSAPVATTGTLSVSGSLIDIAQTLDLGGGGLIGFERAHFSSKGDIRLSVAETTTGSFGRLWSSGTLVLESAQTYVTTAGRSRNNGHPGFVVESATTVEFVGNGGVAPVPYSYGETLTVMARDIVQGGVLRAPLGKIDLHATESLTLVSGGLTSVSAEGKVIPMGSVEGGFVTPFPLSSEDSTLDNLVANNPSKFIRLSGKTVEVRHDATVDVSGGGDLGAYEFIPGNGGSRDILNDTGMFAVLRGYVSPAAPVYGKDGLSSGSLKPGDSVFLSGVNGLADGVYTLLPAHYALLEGGFAIKALASGFDSVGATVKLPDGSQLVGGHRTVAGSTVRDAGETRFAVMSQDVFKKYSAYNEYGYNEFLSEAATKAGITTPRLPLDAGSLVVRATDSLVLDGRGRFGAPEDGLLGNLDIDATKIALVGDTQSAPQGYLKLNASDLNDFGIGSLLLGGTRETTADGVALTVSATDILVANDSASALVIPEIILAATNAVTVADGSVIRAEGRASGAVADLLLTGNGALLRASSGDRVNITRTGSTTDSGDLTLGDNVTLAASGSLMLDGTRSLTNKPGTLLVAPRIALSSARVSIGDAPGDTAGLVLTGTTLAAIGAAQDLLIRSYGSIDLYGSANLGALDASGRPVLEKLTLDSSSLNGFGLAGDTATLAAKTLTLTNRADVAASGTASGTGALALVADTLVIGAGTTSTIGFTSANVAADKISGTVVGNWNHTGDLTLATDLLTSSAGATTGITASGAVSITQGRGTSQSAGDFGGRLAVTGASVAIDTAVVLPAGIFEATATTGDLTIGGHARIAATGYAKDFYDVTKVTSGGTIRLTSSSGDVTVASGAQIDVSGNTRGGDAGSVEIRATRGALNLTGTLVGTAASGNSGGSFTADAGTVSDFSTLNAKLNAGGFDAARSVRVRTGDLTLAAGESIAAHDVDLRVDTGTMTVNGSILAAGTDADRDGGTVALRAGNGVTLGSTALIDVSTGYTQSAKGFDTQSGKVAVLADDGDVAVISGSKILGSGGVRGGASVVITARRDDADIRVTEFAATVEGAREVILRGRRDYALTNVATANYNTMFNDTGTWMDGASAIATRLGLTDVEIQPDIRIISDGNLTLANDVSLHTRRYGANMETPGALNFEAAGDITVNGGVSDGFSTATSAGVLQAGRSWSLGFTAGGDITVGNATTGRIIRTGTGDITMNAGRDLLLKNTKSVIYTAGSKVADADGYIRGTRRGDYPVNGGDIDIVAGRDITAPITKDFVTAWLFRYGFADTSNGLTQSRMTVGAQTGWSVVFANFEQGVGALGGGDISVKSGHDITNLSVVLPTTGQQTAAPGDGVLTGEMVVRGGGNLRMRADNDILGGVTMLGRGDAKINAGGDVTAGEEQSLQRKVLTVTSTAATNYESRDLHALFALADATLELSARGDLEVEAIVDPMMIPLTGGTGGNIAGNGNRNTFFMGYTERSGAALVSVGGDVTYLNNPWAAADLARGNTARPINQQMSVSANITVGTLPIARDLIFVPGTMRLISMQGGVALSRVFEESVNLSFRLAPTSTGNLEMLANDDITAKLPVMMMDVASEYRRTSAAPFRNAVPTNLNLAPGEQLGASLNYGRGTTPTHAGDSESVRLYSNTGDISGDGEVLSKRFAVYLPKSAKIRAGGDISDITLTVQHNEASSVSEVDAGRDILRPDIRVLGTGNLFVQAGRDIDMTSREAVAIVATGNVGNLLTTNATPADPVSNIYPNLALKNTGADITLSAGAANADYASFADKYLNPANAGTVVCNYLPELRDFMATRGTSGDDASLLGEFNRLPVEVRQSFLLGVYFTELKETGIDVTNPESPRHGSYARGFDAVKSLFGESGASSGDINLFGKSLATQQGGDITVLAPHGKVMVDVITNPAASSQGIVTQKGGDILMMTDGDIALANSRVFTLQGGDILMWTSKGNITAGAGSSTRAIPPALVYTVDSDANVLLNAGSLNTGAGIGVLDANRTGTVSSRLDLIAPAGAVDAGDAGIRSVGAINIAAQTIIGAANISAGGGITGIVAAPTVNVAAVASANSSAATSGGGAPDAAEEQRRQAVAAQEQTPSVFSVEVLGYGGGTEDDKKGAATAANDAKADATTQAGIKS